MKKSLLAVAALTAIAGSAQAQSSVTIYGILDVGYLNQSVKNSGVPGANAPVAPGGNNVGLAYGSTTTNSAQFGSSAESTSRLGFKGNEDLGGGLSAFFTVETGLTPTNGTTVSAFNNRQSFVGLGKAGVGTASIGTQYTPIHEAVSATDPGQANNMPGNLIYASDLSVNSTASATSGPLAAPNSINSTNIGGPAAGSVPYTVRAGNSLKLQSDNFAGFVGKFFYSAANSTTSQTNTIANGQTTNVGGIQNAGGWGLGADYTWNKLLVTADYQQFKQITTGATITNVNGLVTAASTTTAAGVTTATPAVVNTIGTPTNVISGTSYGTALNSQDNQAYLAATYDFGILKAYAQYLNRKENATYDTNTYTKRVAEQIGVRSFITPAVEAWASGALGKLTNAYGVQAANAPLAYQTVGVNMTAWQLGSNYWLSKRTNLYAIYGQTRTSNGVYPQTVNGNTATVNANSSAVSAYALGVRHTF